MVPAHVHDLNYLAARIHGRRSRVADGERLPALCRCRGVPELAHALYPGDTLETTGQLQRRLVEDWVGELHRIQEELSAAQGRLLQWMIYRFAVQNMKIALRGVLTGASPIIIRQHLLTLPEDLGPDAGALAEMKSLAEFIERLPEGPLCASLREGSAWYRGRRAPFFYEGLVDRGYFGELLARANALAAEERTAIMPIVAQESDIFHLMLVVRGRFLNGLEPELLLPLHVDGTAIPRRRFAQMLRDTDVAMAVGRVVRRVLDAAPPFLSPPLAPSSASPGPTPTAFIELEAVESMAWARLLRLANRAFRASPMGFDAVVGYAVIRRMEVANLITISEGIQAGLAGEAIAARLIPRRGGEADDV